MNESTFRWVSVLALAVLVIVMSGNVSHASTLQAAQTPVATFSWPSCAAHPQQRGGVAFSPDGKEVLAGWELGQERIWDTATGKVLQTLSLSDDAAIYSVAFSPDGKSVLIGLGKEAELFDRQAGKLLHSFSNDPQALITTAAFLPDGKSVMTFPTGGIGLDGAVQWDLVSGRIIHEFQGTPDGSGHDQGQLSPDGEYVMTSDLDNWYLWDVRSGAKLHTFPSPAAEPAGFSQDGKLLFVNGRPLPNEYDSVSVWELNPLKQVNTLKDMAWLGGWQVSMDTRYLLWDDVQGTTFLVDVRTGAQLQSFHDENLNPIQFLPDSKHILVLADTSKRAYGTPTTLIIWGIVGEKELRRITIHPYGSVGLGIISPDGKTWLTSSDFGEIRLWSLETGDELERFC